MKLPSEFSKSSSDEGPYSISNVAGFLIASSMRLQTELKRKMQKKIASAIRLATNNLLIFQEEDSSGAIVHTYDQSRFYTTLQRMIDRLEEYKEKLNSTEDISWRNFPPIELIEAIDVKHEEDDDRRNAFVMHWLKTINLSHPHHYLANKKSTLERLDELLLNNLFDKNNSKNFFKDHMRVCFEDYQQAEEHLFGVILPQIIPYIFTQEGQFHSYIIEILSVFFPEIEVNAEMKAIFLKDVLFQFAESALGQFVSDEIASMGRKHQKSALASHRHSQKMFGLACKHLTHNLDGQSRSDFDIQSVTEKLDPALFKSVVGSCTVEGKGKEPEYRLQKSNSRRALEALKLKSKKSPRKLKSKKSPRKLISQNSPRKLISQNSPPKNHKKRFSVTKPVSPRKHLPKYQGNASPRKIEEYKKSYLKDPEKTENVTAAPITYMMNSKKDTGRHKLSAPLTTHTVDISEEIEKAKAKGRASQSVSSNSTQLVRRRKPT